MKNSTKFSAVVAGIAAISLAGCVTPQLIPPVVLGHCVANVTEVPESAPYPCIPTPPQRVDRMLSRDGRTDYQMNMACYAFDGQPVMDVDATGHLTGLLRCRTVLK